MSNDCETVIATPYYLPDQLCDVAIEQAKIKSQLERVEDDVIFNGLAGERVKRLSD